MNINNLKNHSLYTSSEDIKAITKPLFDYFGIASFTFTRHYKSKHRIVFPIATMIEKTEASFKNVGQVSASLSLSNDPSYSTFKERILGMPNNSIKKLYEKQLIVQMEKFKIENEFIIKKNHDDYFDLFELGIPMIQSNQIILRLINNQDLLQHFTAYFYDKAHSIIARADKEKISFTGPDTITSPSILIPDYSIESLKFLQETQIKKFHCLDTKGNPTTLTHKEWLIASHLSKSNNTAKHIANKLSLSSRTVEMHISNLNKKLLCFDRTGLTNQLNTFNLIKPD